MQVAERIQFMERYKARLLQAFTDAQRRLLRSPQLSPAAIAGAGLAQRAQGFGECQTRTHRFGSALLCGEANLKALFTDVLSNLTSIACRCNPGADHREKGPFDRVKATAQRDILSLEVCDLSLEGGRVGVRRASWAATRPRLQFFDHSDDGM